jgi:hypothetical protein
VAHIHRDLTTSPRPAARVLVRLDGLSGVGATLSDRAGRPCVRRGTDAQVLGRTDGPCRLSLPPDQPVSRPERADVRTLSDGPDVPGGPDEQRGRVVVAPHPPGPNTHRVGVARVGIVEERFVTTWPHEAFPAADVVALSLHRGACDHARSDDDTEHEPNRWCRQTSWGQMCWQVMAQWVWNLRVAWGHHMLPDPVRTTACAPASLAGHAPAPDLASPVHGSGPAAVASSWKAERFSDRDGAVQPDGTVCGPASQQRCAHERRREADGRVRVVDAASMRRCRPCSRREQCQWLGNATMTPRQVRVLVHPLTVGVTPVLWRDGGRRRHRRACMQLLRPHQVTGQIERDPSACSAPPLFSRAQRAQSRLDRSARSARTARLSTANPVPITRVGVPERRALSLGFVTIDQRRTSAVHSLCSDTYASPKSAS